MGSRQESNPGLISLAASAQLLICTAQVVLNAPVATLAATQQHPKLALTSCSAANVSLFLAEEKHLVQFSGKKRGRCGRSASHVTSACLSSLLIGAGTKPLLDFKGKAKVKTTMWTKKTHDFFVMSPVHVSNLFITINGRN